MYKLIEFVSANLPPGPTYYKLLDLKHNTAPLVS